MGVMVSHILSKVFDLRLEHKNNECGPNLSIGLSNEAMMNKYFMHFNYIINKEINDRPMLICGNNV
jgi:hypothetical protein